MSEYPHDRPRPLITGDLTGPAPAAVDVDGRRPSAEALDGDGRFDQQSKQGLRRVTVSGGLVTAAAQATQLMLQLGMIAILSRSLGPDAFGVVAMVATLSGVLRVFTDAGLGTSTIQRAGLTHAQVSNLFWANAVMGAALAGSLAALASSIAWFYREPRLVMVAVALAPAFVLNGLAVQHLALLRRQMRYHQLALIQTASVLAGTLLAVTLAWLGADYWSLVAMQLMMALASCVLAWLASGWHPQLPILRSGTRPLVSFGMKLTLSNCLWTLAKSADSVLVGRIWGVDALGLYSRGGALLMRPLEQVMAPLDGLIVPVLARLQDQPDRFRRAAFEVFDLVAMMSLVVSGVLLALSYPLTLVVLGPQWQEAAPIFAAFTFVALYAPTTNVAGWVLTSQGRGRDVVWLSAVTSALTTVLLLLGVQFGPAGVAAGYALSGMLVQLPLAYYIVGRTGPIRTGELWQHLLTHAPLYVLAAGVSDVVRRSTSEYGTLMQVILAGLGGLLAAGLVVLAFPHNRRVLRLIRENVGFGAA